MIVTNEFIFVVDCSGSMADENKIGFARQAMLLFLKSLPVNCHFNIIRFGSNYESLFKDDITAIYNKENAQQAEQLTNNMQANLGGTELVSFRFFQFYSCSLFFYSYLLFNGLNNIHQKKVVLDKSFF